MKRCVSIIFCALALALMDSCSQEGSSGTTMETENSVAVQVLDSMGVPVAGAHAAIRPLWYVSDTVARALSDTTAIRDAISDSQGWIRCQGLPTGAYRIEVGLDSLAAGLEFVHADTGSTKIFSSLWLAQAGSLSGRIPLPVGVHRAWVQVYGSEHVVATDSLGRFALAGLPVGVARVRAFTAAQPSVLAEDLALVRPGRAVGMGTLPAPTVENEDRLTWRYSRTLRADSLVYDWMRPVSDTTVLTIRLDSTNFDFAQAMADGRDLRIEDEAGSPLVHERVLWAPDLGRAVVRVHMVDVGLDTTTAIFLRWGHDGAIELGSEGLWDGVPDSLYKALTSMLVGDFERGDARTDLPGPIPASYWYIGASDSATLDSSLAADFMAAIQLADAGRSGRAAHVTYAASAPYWVLLGAKLGPGPRCLAALDSVVFYARGNGLLSFALDNLDGPGTKAWLHITLDTAWTRYRVTPADFLPGKAGSYNVGWEALRDSVTNLTFLANSGNSFWIDSVALYGVGVDDLR